MDGRIWQSRAHYQAFTGKVTLTASGTNQSLCSDISTNILSSILHNANISINRSVPPYFRFFIYKLVRMHVYAAIFRLPIFF